MAITPFHDIPKATFLSRMALPLLGIFSFLFLCVGVIANSTEFQQPKGPAAVIPFWLASFKHYQGFLADFAKIPAVCWVGNTVNEFQVSQCSQTWEQLLKVGGLALAPIVILGFIWVVGLDQVSGLYRKTTRKIEKGESAFTGTVTNPPEAPRDFFCWFYCLRPIMVQLTNRSQVKVYVPVEMVPPRAGETLIAFDLGSRFGETRKLGMIYAPHVAVVRGG